MSFFSILSSHVLEPFSDEDSTMSVGRFFQWSVLLTVKNLILYSTMQVASDIPCSLPMVPCEERAFLSFSVTLLSTENLDEAPSPGHSLLQGEKTKFLQSFLTAQVLQSFDHLCSSPLDPLKTARYLKYLLALTTCCIKDV